jgi:hypothetical protein
MSRPKSFGRAVGRCVTSDGQDCILFYFAAARSEQPRAQLSNDRVPEKLGADFFQQRLAFYFTEYVLLNEHEN